MEYVKLKEKICGEETYKVIGECKLKPYKVIIVQDKNGRISYKNPEMLCTSENKIYPINLEKGCTVEVTQPGTFYGEKFVVEKINGELITLTDKSGKRILMEAEALRVIQSIPIPRKMSIMFKHLLRKFQH